MRGWQEALWSGQAATWHLRPQYLPRNHPSHGQISPPRVQSPAHRAHTIKGHGLGRVLASSDTVTRRPQAFLRSCFGFGSVWSPTEIEHGTLNSEGQAANVPGAPCHPAYPALLCLIQLILCSVSSPMKDAACACSRLFVPPQYHKGTG